MNTSNNDFRIGMRYTYPNKDMCYRAALIAKREGHQVQYGISELGNFYFEITDPFQPQNNPKETPTKEDYETVRAELENWPDWKKEITNELLCSTNARKLPLGTIRRLDALGRIVIPKDIQKAINNGKLYEEGTVFELFPFIEEDTGRKGVNIYVWENHEE